MDFSLPEIEKHIPYYLTLPRKVGLLKALQEFPNCNYYITAYKDEVLQGDGWSGVEIIRFEDGSRNAVHGIVLSNSCDIDPQNERDTPSHLTFATLIPVSVFARVLDQAGLTEQQKTSKLDAIRGQQITSLFYLPQGGELREDHIALLDDLHTVPLPYYLQKADRKKLFTLSDVGFYIFLMKLSIHFCRMHEEVDRTPT